MGIRRHWGQWALQSILAVLGVLTFAPIVILLILSVKDVYQFNVAPMGLTFPMRTGKTMRWPGSSWPTHCSTTCSWRSRPLWPA